MIFFVAVCAAIRAVPARRDVWRDVVTADGQAIVVSLVGDEHAHWWADAEGRRYDVGDDGVAVLLTEDDVSALVARAQARRARSDDRRRARVAPLSGRRAIFEGRKRGLVILVNFADKAMASATAGDDFDRMFNEAGFSDNGHIGSVADYFADQSYGLFGIDFDVVGPVTVSRSYSYYGQNDVWGDDRYPCTMVIEACQLVDDEVDFSDYDWDGDGEVDQVFVIYAGYGENYGAASNTIWPHEWTLAEGKDYGDGDGAQVMDGVVVNEYAVSCELAGTRGDTMDGIGTACHEFAHCLGYPDFYDTMYTGGWGMQAWDLLANGSYNGPTGIGEIPVGFTAYERWVAGWVEPTVVEDGMTVDVLLPLGDAADAYVLYNDGDENEYFLFENRQSERWFSYVSSYAAPSGLLVTHVDYDADAWEDNIPNGVASHQRMTIIQANNSKGTYVNDGSGGYYVVTEAQYMGHLYPYEDNDSLTQMSVPSSSTYNRNAEGRRYMSIGIYDICQNADGSMSFYCSSTGRGGDEGDDGLLFYESFDGCAGEGGNDGVWAGAIGEGVLTADNDGWGYNYAGGADRCALFGAEGDGAEVVSPVFMASGASTLRFLAGLATDDVAGDGVLTVTAGDERWDVAVGRGEWTEVVVGLSCVGPAYLSFAAEGRLLLDEVSVRDGQDTGIKTIDATPVRLRGVYTLAGQKVGEKMSDVGKGIYIVDGRKIVKR